MTKTKPIFIQCLQAIMGVIGRVLYIKTLHKDFILQKVFDIKNLKN